MWFYPFGPVAIDKASNGLVPDDKDSFRAFWDRANLEIDDLSEAVGCYIFSIRAGKGLLPWYVGCAEKQPFRAECFTSHKLNHYNGAIANRKGTPILTFLPKFTATERYSKPSDNGHRDIRLLESMLIAACLRRNADLLNVRDTQLLREMVVPGLLNTPRGRLEACVTVFKALLGT